jgi:hypothetical protein
MLLLLGLVVGAWFAAAVWRIGMIVAVAIIIAARVRAMRHHSRTS